MSSRKMTMVMLVVLFSLMAGLLLAGEIPPDAPLEPEDSLETTSKKYINGSLVEFWFLQYKSEYTKFPIDPPVAISIDTSDQVFDASFMARDAEMKQYINRAGLVRWTTFLKISTPGKHVFVFNFPGKDYPFVGHGANVRINGEGVIQIAGSSAESATVDFAQPGLYALDVRYWATGRSNWSFKIDFSTSTRLTIKVREPGKLTARTITKKDLFMPAPEEEEF